MDFGITFKGDIPIERTLALTRQAEAAGFRYGWAFDSHVLWNDPYPVLTLMAANTKHMHLGPCVTNPRVRDITVMASLFATMHQISGGRMELGIGRGDSSRRVLGKKPTTVEVLEETVWQFRELTAGKEIQYDGRPVRLPWATNAPRVWVAGYGPKVLRSAGRVADGIILQFADPDLIKWCMGFVYEGAKEAKRNPKDIQVMSAAPVWVSDDIEYGRSRVRWFPALVSNHVVDLLKRYDPKDLPAALTAFVQHRPGYDYQHHAVVGSDNATFVSDEVVDRFCILGPAKAHVEKLKVLREAGVTQFNIYLMCGEEEKTLVDYEQHVLPKFR